MPSRIQRKRTKGWRMPEGAVYVGRPTKWGNRFEVGAHIPLVGHVPDRQTAVMLYENLVAHGDGVLQAEALLELRGHDLACWCPLDQPCHADVLLELANA